MAVISVSQAAKRLGVSERRVRALAENGDLPAEKLGGRWLVDSDRLADHSNRSSERGRPFSALHAIGLLYLASGEEAGWLSDYERWRLKRNPRNDLSKDLPRLRARARVGYWRAPASLIGRLTKDPGFVRSGVSAADEFAAAIHGREILDGYLDAREAKALAHRYALARVPEIAANLVLREIDDTRPLAGRRVMPIAVIAADLADSSDQRTRRAGRSLMQRVQA